MELRIKRIVNAGDIRSEYIELFVNESINLKNFIVSDTCYMYATKSETKHIYWFPELAVKPGSMIRLNTRQGLNDHIGYIDLYWNLDKPLWKVRFATAYIIKIDNYVVYPEIKNYLDTLFSSD